MHAVGADQCRAFQARAVVAKERDGTIVLFESCGSHAERYAIRRGDCHRLDQDAMQIGAMDHEIGRAVTLARYRAEIEQFPGLARAPESDFLADRLAPDLLQRGFEPEREQRVCPVRGYLDAGADLGEPARLLDHPYAKASPDQRQRGAQSADTGAGDQNRKGLGHRAGL